MSGIVPWAGGGAFAPSFVSSVPTAPTPQPSLREWWRQLQQEIAPQSTRVQSAVMGLRHNGESAAMAAILALIDTELGGLDLGGRIPLDWVGAAIFYALSVQDAGNTEGLASDFRALGQSCTTVAMYRMVHRWRESRKAIPQNRLSGDPVLAAGKSVSF
jgi:hypothetical protein